MRNFAALLVFSVIFLGGCTSIKKQPISQKSISDLNGQTVAQTKRKLPDFAAMTPGKAAFAMLGAFAMISEGNKIIASNKVPDPADAIAAELVAGIVGKYTTRAEVAVDTSSDDPVQIAKAAKDRARFILDVQTVNWSFGYFPTDWTHYRVLHVAKARLIDTQSNSVVAEGFCRHIPEKNLNAPTYDDLLVNEAALLKSTLSTIAGECAKTLKAEMFSL